MCCAFFCGRIKQAQHSRIQELNSFREGMSTIIGTQVYSRLKKRDYYNSTVFKFTGSECTVRYSQITSQSLELTHTAPILTGHSSDAFFMRRVASCRALCAEIIHKFTSTIKRSRESMLEARWSSVIEMSADAPARPVNNLNPYAERWRACSENCVGLRDTRNLKPR